MTPPQVLHEQAALIDHLESRIYASYLAGIIDDMERKGKIGYTGVTDVENAGRFMAETLARSLRVAQAFHVKREMTPVIRTAAQDLEGTDYLVHERLPAEHGFLLFDESWDTHDMWGVGMKYRAMSWRHGAARMAIKGQDQGWEAGIWITMFTDVHDPDANTLEIIAEAEKRGVDTDAMDLALGHLQVNHFFFQPYKERIGPAEILTDEEYATMAAPFNIVPHDLVPSVPNDRRMVVALFRLLQQTLVVVRDEKLDRRTRRMAERKNIPARVQTVQLRRREYTGPKPEGEGHIEWSHSWIVRGHWAWRACGEDHPLSEPYDKGWHARVYITPYVKGPEGKPLVVTDKVWSLSR